MTITIIGNNANNMAISDGGRIKIRLFAELLTLEKNEVNIIELEGWKRHPISLLLKIRTAIKKRNRIIIMAGPKGCRKIIPLVHFLNKKRMSRVVFCPLGIGTLDYVIRKLSPTQAQAFLSGDNTISKRDKRMGKILSTFEYVVVQNQILLERYRTFYNIQNLVILENFRNVGIIEKEYSNKQNELSIIYASRVKTYKGILDLMCAIKELNSYNNIIFKLDIYGENQLDEEGKRTFNDLLKSDYINYYGTISSKEMISTLQNYDLFCLPTKYYGEGTSGSLVEAMLSGTPVLVSHYSQADELINDNVDGFIYDFNSLEALKGKLLFIANNKELLKEVGLNAQKKAAKYTYIGNRDNFLKIMTGNETK